MNCPTKIIVTFFVACCFFVSSANLFAQSMHGTEELNTAIQYSVPYDGQALWISYTYEGWPEYPLYVSAVRVNPCWGMTAGHVIFNDNGFLRENFRVGNGTNWVDDRGVERPIAEYHLHPSWDGSWNGHKIDLALVRWDQPLPGEDLVIGDLSLNEQFDYIGYARPGTPDLGVFPADGKRRGWEAKVSGWGNMPGTISTSYVRSTFWQGELALGGIGTPGGSGSGGISSAGELVALLVYSVGAPNYLGSSYGVRLNLHKEWIESHTSDLSCVPPTKPRPNFTSLFATRAHLVSACPLGHGC